MALKTGIFFLALGALLLGSTAQADGNHDRRYGRAPRYEHNHNSDCRHGPQPTPPQNEQGRYELKLTQQWVPGRYEQVWVPQDCRYKPRRGTTQCRGGYYDQRWVEGRYETVEQWVWVPSRWHRSTGPEWGTPVHYSY
jgi:hypothetical protein